MELLIDCEKTISLISLNEINEVVIDILRYDVKKNTLEGEVIIKGDYLNQNSENLTFEEIVPFNINFNHDIYKIEDISIVNFKYYEIVNQGIECSFEIMIKYIDKNITSSDDNTLDSEELQNLEILKEKIEDIYEEKLEEILSPRKVDIMEEQEVLCKQISVDTLAKVDNRVDLRNIKDTYSNYRIYYIKDEEEVNEISNKENKSLNEIFVNNKNFEKSKKIIIK